MLVMFFLFLSPAFLRRPSIDRRETLPHDRKLGGLDKLGPKIRGAPPPKKNGGPKTCKISGDFLPLLTLIANIFGTDHHVQSLKIPLSTTTPSTLDQNKTW